MAKRVQAGVSEKESRSSSRIGDTGRRERGREVRCDGPSHEGDGQSSGYPCGPERYLGACAVHHKRQHSYLTIVGSALVRPSDVKDPNRVLGGGERPNRVLGGGERPNRGSAGVSARTRCSAGVSARTGCSAAAASGFRAGSGNLPASFGR